MLGQPANRLRLLLVPLLACLTLAWMLLVALEPVRAAHDGTCHPSGGLEIGSLKAGDTSVLGGELNLKVILGQNDRSRVAGSMQMQVGERTQTLVPVPGTAQASCASTGRDGVDGLARLAFDARNTRSGDELPVSITSTGNVIAEPGVYEVAVAVGELTTTIDVRAAYGPPGRR